MKKLIVLLACCCLIFSLTVTGAVMNAGADADFSKSPKEFVSGIKVGWNLGNTFDCYTEGVGPYEQETSWNNKQATTQEMIAKVAESGFNAIRIPISWGSQVTESNGVYTVNPLFFKRLKEVISWCYSYDMYVIINMHHDDGKWLNISVDDDEWEVVKEKYRQIWEQVADSFKYYNEKLIFEGANEVTATCAFDGCGTGTGKCWWGHSTDSFERLNELYQIFVDTVRDSGGNNGVGQRYLMLSTYGAQWYNNQINRLTIPNGDSHIIVDIHWYAVSDQMNESKRRGFADTWKSFSNANKVGIVIGECGFYESASETTKVSWAGSFVKDLKDTYDIPVFLWDDGGDMRILERTFNPVNWSDNSQKYIAAVMEAVGVNTNAEDTQKTTATKPSSTSKPPVSNVLGDIDNDGMFTIRDVILFRRYLVNLDLPDVEEMPETGDYNGDGYYNMKDVFLMRKNLAQLG